MVWKQYQSVKAGAVLFTHSESSTQIPGFVSIIVMGILTVLVVAIGAMSYFLGFQISTSVAVRLTILMVNLLLWAMVLFLWYRLFTARAKPQEILLRRAATEGVWPPPPRIPLDNREHDGES